MGILVFQLRIGARCFKSPAHSLDKGVEMGAGALVKFKCERCSSS